MGQASAISLWALGFGLQEEIRISESAAKSTTRFGKMVPFSTGDFRLQIDLESICNPSIPNLKSSEPRRLLLAVLAHAARRLSLDHGCIQ